MTVVVAAVGKWASRGLSEISKRSGKPVFGFPRSGFSTPVRPVRLKCAGHVGSLLRSDSRNERQHLQPSPAAGREHQRTRHQAYRAVFCHHRAHGPQVVSPLPAAWSGRSRRAIARSSPSAAKLPPPSKRSWSSCGKRSRASPSRSSCRVGTDCTARSIRSTTPGSFANRGISL